MSARQRVVAWPRTWAQGEKIGTTEALARFIAETQYDDLPVEVVAAVNIGILDGVANLLAGSTQPVAQIVSAYTLELGGTPVSSVIGHGFKTNPLNAAFANGVSGHCPDFELHGQPSSHGTSSILPGPLALAEAQGGASGKELIVAYALGWDVQQRIVAASHRAGALLRGFHPPGVYGPVLPENPNLLPYLTLMALTCILTRPFNTAPDTRSPGGSRR